LDIADDIVRQQREMWEHCPDSEPDDDAPLAIKLSPTGQLMVRLEDGTVLLNAGGEVYRARPLSEVQDELTTWCKGRRTFHKVVVRQGNPKMN
jgi:hypothetical protein